MPKIKLLPCPFCGAPATINSAVNYDDTKKYFYFFIECSKIFKKQETECLAKMTDSSNRIYHETFTLDKELALKKEVKIKRELRTKWNTRTKTTNQKP